MDNVGEWIKGHMTLVLLLVGGLAVGVIFLKKAPATTGTTAQPQADLSGLAVDANGHPIVYRDVADTFINITKTIGAQTIGSYNTDTNPAQPVASAPSPAPTTPSAPVEHPIEAIIRTKDSSSTVAAYDASHPGIPIRASASATAPVVGYLPFGSSVALSGDQVTAAGSNFAGKNASKGSTSWLQTSQGYVSGYDVTGFLN
jgi:hypothetical protein